MIETDRSRSSSVSCAALGRHRLQGDLEPTLQVEAERRLVVDRRGGIGKRRHRDERGDDERDDDYGSATVHERPPG